MFVCVRQCVARWALWGWALLWVPLTAADGLRLGVDETTAGFPGFATFHEDGQVTGALIDFWRCVLEPEGKALTFSLMPLLRSSQALANDDLDMHLSTLLSEGGETLNAHYTDAFFSVHVALISLAANAPLLRDGVWQQQTLGVVLKSDFNQDIQHLGGQVSDQVGSFQQLLKLLLGGRVSLISLPLVWSAEEVSRYRGAALAGRNLTKSAVHGVVSQYQVAKDPEFMGRVNGRMGGCRLHLKPVSHNIFQ